MVINMNLVMSSVSVSYLMRSVCPYMFQPQKHDAHLIIRQSGLLGPGLMPKPG